MVIIKGIALGTSVAFLNGILSVISIRWAFRRSSKVFFGTFFAGMIWKLAALGATLYYLIGKTWISAPWALASLGLATFFLNLIELWFIPGIKRQPDGL